MKTLYTLFAAGILAATTLNATVITSAQNGNATSPLTWDCMCIPTDGDTIIINHAITLDVDYAYTMGGIEITSNGIVTGNANNRILGVSGGYFLNNGTLIVGYFVHNGGTVTNNAAITALGSILIDQAVTLNNYGTLVASDSSYVNTNGTLNNYNIFDGAVCLTAGNINNHSLMNVQELLNTGTINHNAGATLTVAYSMYNLGTINLNGTTTVQGDIWNAENMTVNYFVQAQTLYNGDTITGTATFTNNGTVSLGNSLFNSEDLNGSGDFCVVDSTLNSGNVNGTLDICDQSGSNWDLNAGMEAGTVTHCAAGPCSIGIQEVISNEISMLPNPAHDMIQIEIAQSVSGTIQVIDVTGRVVLTETVNGNRLQLNILTLPEGLYTIAIVSEQHVYNGRFVKE